jgi:hypothetical protein
MYRPGRLKPRAPKLDWACERHVLLDLAWRHDSGQTNHRNVTTFFEGEVLIDVVATEGGGACLWPLVETSPDTSRWADLIGGPPITEKGFYRVPCSHLGAFLRVAYRLHGAMQFGIEWVGKSLVVGSGRPEDVLSRR